MLLGLEFIDEAQPALDVSKPLLICGGQRSAASTDDHPPAVFLIADYSERCSGTAAPPVEKFLRDDPIQIDARKALLSHTCIRDKRSFPRLQIIEFKIRSVKSGRRFVAVKEDVDRVLPESR
jgi:hypothetical protein